MSQDYDSYKDQREAVLAWAKQLKADIREAEEVIEAAKQMGKEPCPVTAQRLEALRAEQYEISQKI